MAHQAFQANGRLPISFGTLNNGASSELWIGQTIMTVKSGKSDWLPYCIVDPDKALARPNTLLYEIGHAAGAMHNLSFTVSPGELMVDGDITAPITIEQPVVDLLTKAYFCW